MALFSVIASVSASVTKSRLTSSEIEFRGEIKRQTFAMKSAIVSSVLRNITCLAILVSF